MTTTATERRYERLHPAELRRLQKTAPVAWVPIGPLEFHGEHLPVGVDAFEAHGLCLRAAERVGGVVLPASTLACGCLDLPFTLSYAPELVHAWASATMHQLAARGFRVVVVLTGHGPLDLIHLLKRAAREVEDARGDGSRIYSLCWLELNAARLQGPQTEGEPTVVDHAALVETSWMLELQPDLVHLDRLADDPDAAHLGVYGRNPRFTATRAFGASQLEAAASLLAERVGTLLAGGAVDPQADLRAFVQFGWPEALELRGRAGGAEEAALLVHNPGRSSRYLSRLDVVEIDGFNVPLSGVSLRNENVGESGISYPAEGLDAEHGFYVRRGQEATLLLDHAVSPGSYTVRLAGELGGVSPFSLSATVSFTP